VKSIAPKSIARALGLNTTALSGKILTWMVWKLACLKSCNEILKKNYHKKNSILYVASYTVIEYDFPLAREISKKFQSKDHLS
jgi:hypothetical protein